MENPRPSRPVPNTPPTPGRVGGHRLNLLLSSAGPVAWRDESWAESLPRLLEPMGVRTWRVKTGREATRLLQSTEVHIALVDLALPLGDESSGQIPGSGPAAGEPSSPERRAMPSSSLGQEEGGSRLLELLARLDTPPTTIVVKREKTRREDARTLASALHAGAFAVLDRPVHLETALEVMRRILCRYHSGKWPGCG